MVLHKILPQKLFFEWKLRYIDKWAGGDIGEIVTVERSSILHCRGCCEDCCSYSRVLVENLWMTDL